MKIRTERQYRVDMHDDCGADCYETTEIASGTEAEQDTAAETWAIETAEKWAREGDWGDNGKVIIIWYTLSDDENEWLTRWIDVEIVPNHDALIRAAGGDVDCDHRWTGEGEGSCSENPGVWSLGGTALTISEHCEICELRRTRHITGSQRNPGEHDTVKYSLPDTD